jgi:regulator of protease activity HflC (stomatin/prohibitin superfamily)
MVSVDGSVYYRIECPRKCIYSVANIKIAVSELTFATLRAVIGGYTLQEILEKR